MTYNLGQNTYNYGQNTYICGQNTYNLGNPICDLSGTIIENKDANMKQDGVNTGKAGNVYFCKLCNFNTQKRHHYDRHLSSNKHCKYMKHFNITEEKLNDACYECECGKKYTYRQSLYNHRKKCSYQYNESIIAKEPIVDSTQTSTLDKELMKELVKQNQTLLQDNQEFKTMLMELAIKPTTTNNNNNNNNNTHTNSHNKQFNLNFFLNETCKDAMNLTDFIDSLKISFADLEKVGEKGFVEGISRIFINGLKELDVNKRPIHCSDVKREVMHLKNKDEWNKECDEQYPLLSKAIHKISHKNMQTLHLWKDKNPECKDSASKKSDVYLKWMQQSLGPCDKEKDKQNYGRIIQRVAKETFIDKG